MFGGKFYEKYIGPCGLNDARIVELNRDTSMLYFDIDYPLPVTGFYLSHFDEGGCAAFRFILVTGNLQFNSAGRPESIEYVFRDSSTGSIDFNRFYFNNPYGDRIYLLDK